MAVQIEAGHIYRPGQKDEIRLVYRIRGGPDNGRHQKSFSISRYGIEGAKQIAETAKNYINTMNRLPLDFYNAYSYKNISSTLAASTDPSGPIADATDSAPDGAPEAEANATSESVGSPSKQEKLPAARRPNRKLSQKHTIPPDGVRDEVRGGVDGTARETRHRQRRGMKRRTVPSRSSSKKRMRAECDVTDAATAEDVPMGSRCDEVGCWRPAESNGSFEVAAASGAYDMNGGGGGGPALFTLPFANGGDLSGSTKVSSFPIVAAGHPLFQPAVFCGGAGGELSAGSFYGTFGDVKAEATISRRETVEGLNSVVDDSRASTASSSPQSQTPALPPAAAPFCFVHYLPSAQFTQTSSASATKSSSLNHFDISLQNPFALGYPGCSFPPPIHTIAYSSPMISSSKRRGSSKPACAASHKTATQLRPILDNGGDSRHLPLVQLFSPLPYSTQPQSLLTSLSHLPPSAYQPADEEVTARRSGWKCTAADFGGSTLSVASVDDARRTTDASSYNTQQETTSQCTEDISEVTGKSADWTPEKFCEAHEFCSMSSRTSVGSSSEDIGERIGDHTNSECSTGAVSGTENFCEMNDDAGCGENCGNAAGNTCTRGDRAGMADRSSFCVGAIGGKNDWCGSSSCSVSTIPSTSSPLLLSLLLPLPSAV